MHIGCTPPPYVCSMKENTHIDWRDYEGFIDEILDRLLIKKLVSLFDDFERAEGDLFLQMFPSVGEDSDLADEIWISYKKDNDVKEWFENLA